MASVLIGYNDQEVTKAVQNQITHGVNFSLPHPIELEVAELLVEMIPCAEMVRFGKNGTDATSAAIRLARAYTDREHIAICGYHGWQDWSIGITNMNLGVPKAVQELSHSFKYNDIHSLEKIFYDFDGKIAAVIMEPMNAFYPEKDFLEKVRELTTLHNTLLIFDETITGARFAIGGAQALFGVTPDIATFGKGIANGFPLSAVVGKAEVMKWMEKIFFSGTFSGETASLAAAKVVLKRIRDGSLLEKLKYNGEILMERLQKLIYKHQLDKVISVSGHPSWSFLHIKDTKTTSLWEIKTLLLQELFSRGILFIGTHNLCVDHKEKDINFLLNSYDEVFALISQGLKYDNISDMLRADPITPLFKVRV